MPDPLWTSDEIAAATGGEAIGAPFAVDGLSIDTRTLKPGDLFVALAGERDGHDYIAQALAAGAAGALVSRTIPVIPAEAQRRAGTQPLLPAEAAGSRFGSADRNDGFGIVQAPDTLRALERLAAAARDRSAARRCAVTGSVGKTGVTQAVATALRLAGPSHAPVKSFNNHIGVPMTLAALPRDARFAVFELGMNHAGEIGPLSRLVQPHVAVVTTVGPVHTEAFADGEAGVARAKAEVFEGLTEGGVAVLNRDNRWFDLLADAARARGARVLGFGADRDCDAHLLGSEPQGEGRLVRARLHGEEIAFSIAQAGAHWDANSLAVVLAVEALGAPREAALQALAAFAPLAGRGAVRTLSLAGGGSATLIDESYNANPVSMRAAIATLGAASATRRIAVLTDMLELGPEAGRHHAELAAPLRDAQVDEVFLAGPSMRHLHGALAPGARGVWAQSAADLAPAVVRALRPGDVVMVKGSNGSQAAFIVHALTAATASPAGASR